MKNENRTKIQLLKEIDLLRSHITELDKIEISHNRIDKALHESEEKFRILYESSQDAIMMLSPPTWLFTAGNRATIKMFHAKNEKDFISREPWELSPKFQPNGQLSSEKAKKMIQKAMKTGSSFFEWTHNRIKGEEFPTTVLLTKIKLKDKHLLQATVRDITKHKKIDEELDKYRHQLEKLVDEKTKELEEEKNYYHSFVTSLKDWVWEMDLNGIHTYSNPAVESILGYKVEDVVGHHISELWLENTKTLKHFKSLKNTLSLGKGWKNFSGRFQHKHGSLVYTESTAIPIYNSDNELVGYRGLDHDITERKKAEEALLNRENYLLALNKAKKMLMTSDSDNSLQQFVDILGPASNASRTYIFINNTNEKGELLMSQKAENCAKGIIPEIDNPDLQNLKYNDNFQRWEKVLLKNRLISGKVKDFPKEEKEILETQGIREILIIPIIKDSDFIGFIGFDNCISEKEWEEVEKNFLQAAAADLAQFIERKRSQELLQAEFTRFQTTMNAIDAAIYVADMQTHELLFSNKAFNNLFGDKIGEKCYSVVQTGQTKPCDFCTNHLLLDEQGNPRKPYVWEFQNTITKQWYQCRDQAIQWSDGRIVRLEIATDITDSKKAELALHASEERYKYLFEQSPTSIWEQDFSEVHSYLTSLKKSGIKDFKLYFKNHPKEVKQCIEMVRIIDLNEMSLSLYNAKHKHDLITNLNLILTEDSLPSFIDHLCSIAENKTRFSFETINKTFDGKLINIFIKTFVVPGYEKDYSRVLVSLMDVTGQKKAEKSLRIGRERLKLLNQIIRHDLANDFIVIKSAVNLFRKFSDVTMIDEIEKRAIKSIKTIANYRKYESFIDSNTSLHEVELAKLIHNVVIEFPTIEFKIKGKCKIFADDAIDSVFKNLISNSIIHGNSTQINIIISPKKDMCNIRFIDNGTGIPNKFKDKIFDKGFFYGKSGNTGIGLTIVKNTIERYGGHISVEDNEPNGAVFVISLRRSLTK